jgi:hypothetical protein
MVQVEFNEINNNITIYEYKNVIFQILSIKYLNKYI